MFISVIDSMELRSHGGSSSHAGCGSSRHQRSSIEQAMRDREERLHEEI
jgi:hypothetical protein